MSRVHFNSLKPGLFQTARCAAGYMQAILLTCKKIANLLALLLFVFLPLTLKLCEAVVIKCMYKISVDSRLLQKLRLNWGRSEETTNTVFASLQVKNTAGRRFVPADSHYLRAMSYSAVHPVHSPQSQSTNVYVCVKWIRPDDVFSTCLASLDLTLNSKQEGGGGTCAVFTKESLFKQSLDWAAASQIYMYDAMNRKTFVKAWTKISKLNAERENAGDATF